MRTHYTPKVEHACENCGRVALYRPCEVPRFCCRACYVASLPGKLLKPHLHADRICPQCGTAFSGLISQIGTYCSRACANQAKVQDVAARFWAKVDRSGDCWLFATLGTDGYGKFWLNGRSVHASRVAYELTCGAVPAGLDVLHRCDTPACVNPAHLFPGTPQDNVTDMLAKGRKAVGERSGLAKLDATAVLAIRARHAAGAPQVVLAREYGVTTSAIFSIVHRVSWRHIS